MKCHYIYTDRGEKVLIPVCWPVVLSGDMSQCTCRRDKHSSYQYEKDKFNEEVKRLKQDIKDLEAENAFLNRIIRKITKKKQIKIWRKK